MAAETAQSPYLGAEVQPAYYALGNSGWRAYWTLLHPPYTLMHLSFVLVGAALAPELDLVRLAWTLGAFFLAMGIGAHALDEWNGRPLGTTIPGPLLLALAGAGLASAVAIGAWGAYRWDLYPGLILVALGGFFVVAYNLELFSGRVHTDIGFATAWGAFPVLVAYYAQTGHITITAGAGALYGYGMSRVQRTLSTPVRHYRRSVESVEGELRMKDGRSMAIDRADLIQVPEYALRGLVWTSLLVAVALLVRHLN